MAGNFANVIMPNAGAGGPAVIQPPINVRRNGRCDGLTAGLELLHLTEIARQIVVDGFMEQWNRKFPVEPFVHGNSAQVRVLVTTHNDMFGNREDEPQVDKMLESSNSFDGWSNMVIAEVTQALIREHQPDDLDPRTQCFMRAADMLKCTPRPIGSTANLVAMRSTLIDIVTKCNLNPAYIQSVNNHFMYGVYVDGVIHTNYRETLNLRIETRDQQQQIQQLNNELAEIRNQI